MIKKTLLCVSLVLLLSACTSSNSNNTTSEGLVNLNGSTQAQTVSLPSGLQYKILTEGTGATAAAAGNTVKVNYTGKLTDGSIFDSTSRSGNPFSFKLGAGQVIQGWDEGLVGMKVGEVRELTIPPALGYGAYGSPPVIPANATLIFEVEMLSFQ